MKVARLDTLARQDDIFVGGEPEERYKRRQMIVVEDDYDFEANDATDITSVNSLKSMYSWFIINYIEYRDALISYASSNTFSSLSTEDKKELAKNFAVDKSDRDSVLTSNEQKKYAKDVQFFIDEANKHVSFESNSTSIADEEDVPDITISTSSSKYGSYIAETSSEDTSSTSSSNYQTKLTLTTENIVSGKYRISWYFEDNGSDKEDIETEVVLNNSTSLMESNLRFANDGNWIPNSGFKYVTISSGIHTVDIKFRAESRRTVSIRKARLEIIKIT